MLRADADRRKAETSLQQLNADRKRLSKEIAGKKSRGESTGDLEERVRKIGDEIVILNKQAAAVEEEQNNLLLEIANLPHESVPIGKDPSKNKVLRTCGKKPQLKDAADHVALGAEFELFDVERAAKLSGSGFICFTGAGAKLERALINFMMDLHTREHGYTEISPPSLVRRDCMIGTSQLPKFEEDQFWAVSGERLVPHGDGGNSEDQTLATLRSSRLGLIPTAEVPLTNLVRESIIEESALPMRLTALTPCFRAEAGAAGKDTRGMIRQHQFTKVELVSVTAPEESADEHERMLSCAEEVLRRLDLHYRVVTLCTGDMGFAAQKTYDIEVWLPGQGAYREISSCSVCGEFQARRMAARYRSKESRQVRHVHTLNGSGVAVGRALIAVMESYQQQDGSIAVPDVLQPYMGGRKVIEHGQ